MNHHQTTTASLFITADNAWQAELVKAFGKRARSMRYVVDGRGEPNTPLRHAWTVRRHAQSDWDKMVESTRCF